MSVDNRICVTHPSLFVNYAQRGSVIRDPAVRLSQSSFVFIQTPTKSGITACGYWLY